MHATLACTACGALLGAYAWDTRCVRQYKQSAVRTFAHGSARSTHCWQPLAHPKHRAARVTAQQVHMQEAGGSNQARASPSAQAIRSRQYGHLKIGGRVKCRLQGALAVRPYLLPLHSVRQPTQDTHQRPCIWFWGLLYMLVWLYVLLTTPARHGEDHSSAAEEEQAAAGRTVAWSA